MAVRPDFPGADVAHCDGIVLPAAEIGERPLDYLDRQSVSPPRLGQLGVEPAETPLGALEQTRSGQAGLRKSRQTAGQ